MNNDYQLGLSIQDLKQAVKIMRRATERIREVNPTESYTLNTLISDVEEIIERLDK
ncbi:MAG: hypothetical protein WB502_07235 [Thermoactinomyces sp.]